MTWETAREIGEIVQPDACREFSAKVPVERTLTFSQRRKSISSGREVAQGSRDILPALQAAVRGLKEGEAKVVTLKPKEAYGPVDPKAFVEVKKTLVPENLREVGKQWVGRDPPGRRQCFRVHEIKAKTVVLDLNPPLAGKTLIFGVKVIKIE